ncbi:MAG: hemerythrin domain-containing protein [Bdellovibrionota bacterium]
MAIADNKETTYSTSNQTGFFKNMLHDLRKSLRGEVHSIAEIRQEMNLALRKQEKLIPVLKKHHNFIKESLVVCLDREVQDSEKQLHLDRLLQLFEMHAKAEEQTLYKLLIASSEKLPRVDGSIAQDEHELIYRLTDDLRDMHFQSLWTEDVEAKCLVLCEIIMNHFKKEEVEIFPIAQERINSGQLNDMAAEYLNLCDNFLAMSDIRAKGIFL